MGATSMPRMNVIISVICRNILATGIPRPPEVPSEVVMLRARHGGGMSGESMIMSNHNGTYSSSNITIGDYNPQCSIKEVESATAMFNLWGNLIAGIIAAIVTPFWGKLSDRFGRIKPLAAATTVMLFSEALMVLIAKYPDTLSLTWVYLTFVLEGLRCIQFFLHFDILSANKHVVALSYSLWLSYHHTLQTVLLPKIEI
jgi:MFS family permease